VKSFARPREYGPKNNPGLGDNVVSNCGCPERRAGVRRWSGSLESSSAGPDLGAPLPAHTRATSSCAEANRPRSAERHGLPMRLQAFRSDSSRDSCPARNGHGAHPASGQMDNQTARSGGKRHGPPQRRT